MKALRWLGRNIFWVLLVGGLLTYYGYTRIKGRCPLCTVLDKIDAQTQPPATAPRK